MKRIAILSLVLLGIISQVSAQDSAAVDTSWKTSATFNLNFTQINLTNWSAGGESSISGVALFNYTANYLKDGHSWDNSIDLGYGLIKNGDDDIKKSEDKIDLSSKYGKEFRKHWNYSMLLTFKSQFTEGFNYPNDSLKISDFLSPARIYLAPGVDYKPNDNFSLFMTPIAARLIIVNDKDLANAGAYGVDPAEFDINGVLTKEGKKTRFEAGALLKAVYEKDVWENVRLRTKLELFSNYIENPQNVDIDWEVLITLKVNDYLSAQINTQLIYDDDTKLPVDTNGDGIQDSVGPRTQFKELFGVGFSYKF